MCAQCQCASGALAAQRRLRQHQRARTAGGFHFDRQRHVLAQIGRGLLQQGKLHLDGAALRIYRRRNAEHARGKALVGKRIGHHAGGLADLQLLQKTLVHLGHQLRGPGQRQTEQGLARLHDLPRLYGTQQHARIGGGTQRGLCQPGLGRGNARARQLQLCLRLHHLGAHIGIGLHLGSSTARLGLGHIHRTAGLIQLGSAIEALHHQLLRAHQRGLGGAQLGLGLGLGGLGGASAAAAQTGQAGLGLLGRGLGLGQRSAQFVGFELHQHITLAHRGALGDAHSLDPARDGAAHVHAREGGNARRKLQRAHQRGITHRQRIDLRGTQLPHGKPRPGSQQQGSAPGNGFPAAAHAGLSGLVHGRGSWARIRQQTGHRQPAAA